jgi:ABC-type transport system involved in cytochrome c biogenesis permease subunit
MPFGGVLLVAAFLTYVLAAGCCFFGSERGRRVAFWLATAGLACHTVALGLRVLESGRLPIANTYEFLLCFSWATAGSFFVLLQRAGSTPGGAVLALAALFLGVAVFIFPTSQKEVFFLPPALRSAWLTVHVLTAVLAYAAFAAGAGLAGFSLVRKDGRASRELDELVYRITVFGFAMLSLTIVFGAVWAEQAWGSYWSWDPKETWSLFTWIVYALYLHFRRKRHWKGRISAIVVLLGFVLVLFTFFGVNYLMGGLHSYG